MLAVVGVSTVVQSTVNDAVDAMCSEVATNTFIVQNDVVPSR